MKNFIKKTLKDPTVFKQKLWNWAQQQQVFLHLDSNQHTDTYSEFDYLFAIDVETSIQINYHQAFEKLQAYIDRTRDWVFGYMSYDLKNDTEQLSSFNNDKISFPDLFFFQPKKIFIVKGNHLFIKYQEHLINYLDTDLEKIQHLIATKSDSDFMGLNILPKVSKSDYIRKVRQLLQHIQRGDIYEVNFCMEFFAKNAKINPYEMYENLNQVSQPPFASFLKMNRLYAISASPERYLKKTNQNLISQPIKGTKKRSPDPKVDNAYKQALLNDPKEHSENVMIVDLVRHDLSKTAQKNTVKVDELLGIYSFLQVHHLISTISSTVKPDTPLIDIIKTTFPMGSMTGAPKIKAMQLIEKYEVSKRGIYSGALGYITQDGNFDFNVMIRSVLYNEKQKYVSYSVGSAITAKSDPEKEYEECLLKAKALREVLTSDSLD